MPEITVVVTTKICPDENDRTLCALYEDEGHLGCLHYDWEMQYDYYVCGLFQTAWRGARTLYGDPPRRCRQCVEAERESK